MCCPSTFVDPGTYTEICMYIYIMCKKCSRTQRERGHGLFARDLWGFWKLNYRFGRNNLFSVQSCWPGSHAEFPLKVPVLMRQVTQHLRWIACGVEVRGHLIVLQEWSELVNDSWLMITSVDICSCSAKANLNAAKVHVQRWQIQNKRAFFE